MTHPIRIVAHLLQSAKRLMHSQQYRAARHNLLQAVALAPSASAHERIGICSLRLGQQRAARRHLRAAVRMRPGKARTHALLGRASDDPAKAARHFCRAVMLSPANTRYRAEAGLATVRSGDADGGLELLREAVKLAPASFGVIRRLVLGLCEAGLPDEAEGVLLAARFALPNCPKLRGLLGRFRCGQLQPREQSAGDDSPVVLPFLPVPDAPVRRTMATPALVRLRRPSLGRSS